MKTRIVQIEFNDWIAPACFPSPDQQFPAEQVTTRVSHGYWMGLGFSIVQEYILRKVLGALYLLPPRDNPSNQGTSEIVFNRLFNYSSIVYPFLKRKKRPYMYGWIKQISG